MKNRFIDEFRPSFADIALCGSMSHKNKWLAVAKELIDEGFSVHLPHVAEDVNWDELTEVEAIAKKRHYVDRHFANIAASSVVLVCNYEKNGEPGYIGANVLIEMAAAYIYDKPIYILQRPELNLNSKSLEINALGAIVLDNGVVSLIDILKKGGANV